MKLKILIVILAFLLILPELTRAECEASDQTYRYKSAIFYVTNARRIGVSVYNSFNDRYPRCFTAWIKVGGKYVNLDGLPYSPDNWQQAWASTAPSCYNSGYQVVEGSSGYVEYDLEKFAPNGYTGEVEVRVSSDCYGTDPCFCWTANVEVLSYYLEQYCYLDIYVKDDYGNPLDASIYVDGSYLTYASNTQKQVLVGNHTVLASRSGYTSDSKSVSCCCGETKKVNLILSRIQVCTPGEIRNRYCVCSTQVAYEKCKSDGSGWETIIENCPSGYVCSNGYCVLEKDGWYDTGRERCNLYGLECGSGTKEKEQEYRDYTCFGVTCTYVVKEKRWVEIGSCYQDCASGYTCQAGHCVKVTTLPSCTPGYLDEYRCLGNWVQRKYQYSDCSTSWINWEYCDYGCSSGSCISLPVCEEGYLDNFRCLDNWVQREYRYSDCSTSWINWEYCSYGCSAGSCLPNTDFHNIQLTVTTPANVSVGDTITATLRIINSGSVGEYVNFNAYVCSTDSYCYAMNCDGYDPRVYVPAYSTYTSICTAKAEEPGNYIIKVSYNINEQTGEVYSRVFPVEKKGKCKAEFWNEFKCSGNWKLQLYRYSDCTTAWVYVEYCPAGCQDGRCLPSPTTTTTLPATQKEERITGFMISVEPLNWVLLILFLALLTALLLLWLLKRYKPRRDKPEWFGEDC